MIFSASINLTAGESNEGFRKLDIPLRGDPKFGRPNLVGFPLAASVSWSDVRVVDGNRVLSLDEADPVDRGTSACDQYPVAPSCTMSRVMHEWTGAAWQAFNGITPGMEGTLSAFDAFLVRAATPGISLRIPPTPILHDPGRAAKGVRGWAIRLIATSGSMSDPGNLFGQIATAFGDRDIHDLEELPPLGYSYLTILFENARFPESEWGFTSDFRAPAAVPAGVWNFVVRASDDIGKITLRWEGKDSILNFGWLIDVETGEWIRPLPGKSYSFMNGPHEREFLFAMSIR